MVSRQWFRGRHVQSGSCDLATGQGLVEVVLVYHFSPGDDGGCPEALLIARKGLEWLRGEGCPCNTLSGLEASCAHFEDPRQPGVGSVFPEVCESKLTDSLTSPGPGP